VLRGFRDRTIDVASLALDEDDADLPVLAVSGYTRSANDQHDVLDPGVSFLQKPFMPRAAGQGPRGAGEGLSGRESPWPQRGGR
jgi:hypothetical protein